MVAPTHRRPKKAFIQFAIAIVVALVIGAIGIGITMMMLGGISEDRNQVAKEKDQLAQQLSKMEQELKDLKNPKTFQEIKAIIKIPAGTIIDETMVKAVEVKDGEPTEGNHNRIEAVIGKTAGLDIFPGQVLTQINVMKSEGQIPIQAGKRAISISVSPAAMATGILPGARVDVIGTFADDRLTRTLLQNIKVLSVSEPLTGGGKVNKDNNSGNVVIMEVWPKEAELLALASKEALFHLTLRSLSDERTAKLTGIDIGQVVAGTYQQDMTARRPQGKPSKGANLNAPPPLPGEILGQPAAATPAPESKTFTVEIYKGSSAETQQFQWINHS